MREQDEDVLLFVVRQTESTVKTMHPLAVVEIKSKYGCLRACRDVTANR